MDDSFTAFDQVVGESGMSLTDYKGKTVEKWTVLCPALSDGETDCYCVLLVYKAQAIGAYLLEKPSGEVSGLISAAQTMAEDTATSDSEVAAVTGEESTEVSADASDDAQQASADTSPAEADTEVSADAADAGIWPTE